MLLLSYTELLVLVSTSDLQYSWTHFFFKRVEGVLVSGTSSTNSLIQIEHDTKQVGAEKDEKKSALQFFCALMYV